MGAYKIVLWQLTRLGHGALLCNGGGEEPKRQTSRGRPARRCCPLQQRLRRRFLRQARAVAVRGNLQQVRRAQPLAVFPSHRHVYLQTRDPPALSPPHFPPLRPQVAYNSLFLSHFGTPDWDMFQSAHPDAEMHAAARAVGGTPVYVSDRPEAHNFALLEKLVLPDGSTLRCTGAGRPTREDHHLGMIHQGVPDSQMEMAHPEVMGGRLLDE